MNYNNNNIYIREYVNNKIIDKIINKDEYEPKILIEDKDGDWTLYKSNLLFKEKRIELNNFRNRINILKEKTDKKILNDFSPEYQYISDYFYDKTQPIETMKNLFIDINTLNNENLDISNSKKEIKVIKIYDELDDKTTIFLITNENIGLDYLNNDKITIIIFEKEIDLLISFIEYIKNNKPITINAWLGNDFVFPYLLKRLIFNKLKIEQMSPINKTVNKDIQVNGKKYKLRIPDGIYFLDYTKTYSFFKKKNSDSYVLEEICNKELNLKIIKHTDLNYLYENDIYSFIEYEIQNIRIFKELDQTLNYNSIMMQQAWDMGVNFEDIFSTVKPWTYKIYNEFNKRKIALPSISNNIKKNYKGGYVKTAISGLYECVMNFDIKSGYPNTIRTNNISYETLLEDFELNQDLLDLRSKLLENNMEDYLISLPNSELAKIKIILDNNNCIMSPSGDFFSKTIDGVIPEIIEKIFDEREVAKKIYLKLQSVSEIAKTILEKKKKEKLL